jgi:hypothetical protein
MKEFLKYGDVEVSYVFKFSKIKKKTIIAFKRLNTNTACILSKTSFLIMKEKLRQVRRYQHMKY